MDERENNLPKWAQDLIAALRKKIERDPQEQQEAIKRAQRQRDTNDLIKAESEAYRELLECAARGKHLTAAAIIEVLAGYSLTLTKDE